MPGPRFVKGPSAQYDGGMDPQLGADEAYTVPAAERVVRILRYLKQRKRAGVSEIAAALEITRSNCYGILKTLQRHNFVAFDPESKKYSLGLALLELGGAVSRDSALVNLARPHLLRFVEATHLSSLLVQRVSDTRLMVVDKEETASDIRLSIPLGMRFPITHGAIGKCALAYLPEPEVERLIGAVGVEAATSKTVTDLTEYREQLRGVRERGYAASYEESVEGTNVLAAPVFDGGGQVALILASMGFTAALPPALMASHGQRLRRAADAITAAVGGQVGVLAPGALVPGSAP